MAGRTLGPDTLHPAAHGRALLWIGGGAWLWVASVAAIAIALVMAQGKGAPSLDDALAGQVGILAGIALATAFALTPSPLRGRVAPLARLGGLVGVALMAWAVIDAQGAVYFVGLPLVLIPLGIASLFGALLAFALWFLPWRPLSAGFAVCTLAVGSGTLVLYAWRGEPGLGQLMFWAPLVLGSTLVAVAFLKAARDAARLRVEDRHACALRVPTMNSALVEKILRMAAEDDVADAELWLMFRPSPSLPQEAGIHPSLRVVEELVSAGLLELLDLNGEDIAAGMTTPQILGRLRSAWERPENAVALGTWFRLTPKGQEWLDSRTQE